MRQYLIFSFLLFSNPSIGQFSDTLIKGKLVNFQRKRTFGDYAVKNSFLDTTLRAGFGTMQRLITINPSYQLAQQQVVVNGKLNGLSISFWANGIVNSVDYYFEDRLWETISKTDSTGKLLNPGTLVNGNGLVYKYTPKGKRISTTTYKEGYPSGPYSKVGSELSPFSYGTVHGRVFLTEGDLTYRPSAVNYFIAVKMKYINEDNDTVTKTVEKVHYDSVYSRREYFDYKILETTKDSLMQLSSANYILDMHFDDPAVIPKGKWKVFDGIDRKKLLMEVDHDENGNAISIIVYSKGKKFNEFTFPPCGKRKLPVLNDDGSYKEDRCLD